MTLAEALAVCDREYEAEVRAYTPEEAAAHEIEITNEQDAIAQSEAFRAIVWNSCDESESATEWAEMACLIGIRFGMRVQRKLDSANAGTAKPTATVQ